MNIGREEDEEELKLMMEGQKSETGLGLMGKPTGKPITSDILPAAIVILFIDRQRSKEREDETEKRKR